MGFRAFLLDVTKNEVEDEQRLKANQRSFTKVVQQHSFYFPPCIERMRVARTVERVGGGRGPVGPEVMRPQQFYKITSRHFTPVAWWALGHFDASTIFRHHPRFLASRIHAATLFPVPSRMSVSHVLFG